VQRKLGEFEQGRAVLQRALAINEATFGPEHPDVAGTLTNLGLVQQHLGERAAARATLQRALAIFERFLGPTHAHTLQVKWILQRIDQAANEEAGSHRFRLFRRRAQ
jgi:Tfp pilus assembly protein PilF